MSNRVYKSVEITGTSPDGVKEAIDCAIDYSRKTYFTSGVVKTNFGRLPWRDRLRYAGRAVVRRVLG